MKKAFLYLAVVFISVSAIAQTQWKVDPHHSSLNFNISHSGISIVNGKFLEYTGNLTTNDKALKDSKFEFTVDVKSIDTNVDARDNHLKSADFFEVEKHPTMTFKSTKMVASKKANHYTLHGDLTIKGITKPVVFEVTYGGIAKSDKGEKLGMKAQTTINRFDYNINYDPTAAGIGKEVTIIVHLQFAKQ